MKSRHTEDSPEAFPPAVARVARAIRLTMEQAGLTDVALARETGIPRTTLRTYIGGTLKAMDLSKLERIAQASGKTLPDLLSLADGMRGFMKRESPAGKYDIINMGKSRIRIECDTPLNGHHAHGVIHFFPGAVYKKERESAADIWVYLKSEGGILTFDYNHESQDIKGGERVLFNARHPFTIRYIADDRNRRKLKETEESKRQILASFSSSPPFWLH